MLGFALVATSCSSSGEDSQPSSPVTSPVVTTVDPTPETTSTTLDSVADSVDTTGSTEAADPTGSTDAAAETVETEATDPTTIPEDECRPPTNTTPVAVTDLGNSRDFDVTSFDGTTIRAHWFPLEADANVDPAPTVLMGPGWGSPGDTDLGAVGFLGAVSITALRDAGYNVLTWDPRGFGESTGTVTIDSVEFEGRDVQQLIDWIATFAEVELDAQADPRVGMVGASYGGGIQLVTAGVDCRIDAIVPVIAWNSLTTSLNKNNTPKVGWSNLLNTAAGGASLDPAIGEARDAGNTLGVLGADDVEFLAQRGPGEAVANITAPTLVIQGTVDNLFTLDEGITNYTLLADAGTPTAMLWFCGGHGACLTGAPAESPVEAAAIAWLDRYVKGDSTAEPMPGFQFVDQEGTTYVAAEFTQGTGEPVVASGSGTLALVSEGGSGPATVGVDAGVIGAVSSSITPGRASSSVDVRVEARTTDSVIVGAPELTIEYTGTPGEQGRPTRVFAQLVDDSTGIVVGNQITPIEVVLDGQPQTTTVSLESVAFTLHPGASLTLQLTPTTVAYAVPQLGGSITFSDIDVTLPVSDDVSKAAGSSDL